MEEIDKLRANMAAMFLQGLFEGENGFIERATDLAFSKAAVKLSVRLADELIEELERTKN